MPPPLPPPLPLPLPSDASDPRSFELSEPQHVSALFPDLNATAYPALNDTIISPLNGTNHGIVASALLRMPIDSFDPDAFCAGVRSLIGVPNATLSLTVQSASLLVIVRVGLQSSWQMAIITDRLRGVPLWRFAQAFGVGDALRYFVWVPTHVGEAFAPPASTPILPPPESHPPPLPVGPSSSMGAPEPPQPSHPPPPLSPLPALSSHPSPSSSPPTIWPPGVPIIDPDSIRGVNNTMAGNAGSKGDDFDKYIIYLLVAAVVLVFLVCFFVSVCVARTQTYFRQSLTRSHTFGAAGGRSHRSSSYAEALAQIDNMTLVSPNSRAMLSTQSSFYEVVETGQNYFQPQERCSSIPGPNIRRSHNCNEQGPHLSGSASGTVTIMRTARQRPPSETACAAASTTVGGFQGSVDDTNDTAVSGPLSNAVSVAHSMPQKSCRRWRPADAAGKINPFVPRRRPCGGSSCDSNMPPKRVLWRLAYSGTANEHGARTQAASLPEIQTGPEPPLFIRNTSSLFNHHVARTDHSGTSPPSFSPAATHPARLVRHHTCYRRPIDISGRINPSRPRRRCDDSGASVFATTEGNHDDKREGGDDMHNVEDGAPGNVVDMRQAPVNLSGTFNPVLPRHIGRCASDTDSGITTLNHVLWRRAANGGFHLKRMPTPQPSTNAWSVEPPADVSRPEQIDTIDIMQEPSVPSKTEVLEDEVNTEDTPIAPVERFPDNVSDQSISTCPSVVLPTSACSSLTTVAYRKSHKDKEHFHVPDSVPGVLAAPSFVEACAPLEGGRVDPVADDQDDFDGRNGCGGESGQTADSNSSPFEPVRPTGTGSLAPVGTRSPTSDTDLPLTVSTQPILRSESAPQRIVHRDANGTGSDLHTKDGEEMFTFLTAVEHMKEIPASASCVEPIAQGQETLSTRPEISHNSN